MAGPPLMRWLPSYRLWLRARRIARREARRLAALGQAADRVVAEMSQCGSDRVVARLERRLAEVAYHRQLAEVRVGMAYSAEHEFRRRYEEDRDAQFAPVVGVPW